MKEFEILREQELNYQVEKMRNGEVEGLLLYAELKQIKKAIDNAMKEAEESALEEAEMYPEKTFKAFGFSFELRQGRSIPDFKGIKEWEETKSKLKEIEKRHKAAAMNSKIGSVVTDDGEVIQPCKITYSKPSLIVKRYD